MKRVAVVAHRGASGTHPENTASAFAEAVRLQVEAIELDIHLTRDRQLLLSHDASVDRISDGSGLVANMDLSQIRQLDAGGWFDPRFAGERFLILEEALELIPPAITLNVHVKARDNDRDVVVPLTVELLRKRRRLETAFIAADEASLAIARRTEPRLSICNLSTQPRSTYVARSHAINCRILQPAQNATTRELVAEAHSRGMAVNPFYADDEEEMVRLINCGVDGILTNYPRLLQEVLSQEDRA